jgi:DNA-directed RNA polymerase subunit alpha
MGIKWKEFEIPKRLVKEEVTDNYGKFIAEPLERGFGLTFGNSLRRILLSSVEGSAVIAVNIEGVQDEFTVLEGVQEDVTEIILNIRKLVIRMDAREKKIITIDVNKEGVVTAGDIKADGTVEVINTDLPLLTITKKRKFHMELVVAKGRGFVPAEMNKEDDLPIGLIYIDSIFSPVQRVNYDVMATRVGQMTDYDKLVLEIWTNGGIKPDEALAFSAAIWRKYLDVFDPVEEEIEEIVEEDTELCELEQKLNKSIFELELSVRSANCLKGANIHTIKDLVTKSESEMLKYRNFGKRSLTEISAILVTMGLSLNMNLDQIFDQKNKKAEKAAKVKESVVEAEINEPAEESKDKK